MKIYTVKSLDNGVCVTSVRTEDFGCGDEAAMADFGEPQFNAGGLFTTGTKASVTGNVNLSGGHDFSVLQENFTIAVNGATPVTVTLDAACANLAAVVNLINTKLAIVGLEELVEAVASGNYVKLETVSAGAGHTFTLAAGAPDALVVMGLAAGTYTGTGEDDFTLPNDIVRVKSDSPFVAKFDSRDTDIATAKARGGIFGTQIVARIEAAMDDLRAETDDYTDETMITY